ncbi:divergent polysaccharide deacetylase family protein [bacterium]|nr:divergent polysaccharide deacetylase family protein [bacterium]
MKLSSPSDQSQIRLFFESVWAPFLAGGLIILFLIAGRIIMDAWIEKSHEPTLQAGPPLKEIKQRVSDVLVAHEVQWKEISNPAGSLQHWEVKIPADLPESDLYVSLQGGLFDIGAEVIYSHHDPRSGQLRLNLGWADSCLLVLQLVPAAYKRRAGHIAILIDDFGDRCDTFTKSFLDLDADITISIIPGLSHSREMANQAFLQGCEFVMHLPMEPLNGDYPDYGYTLITEMSQKQVEEIFEKSMRNLPQAAGVNNHMGSKVTSDRRIMGYLMNAIKPKNLYFLDSRTTAASVAYDVALFTGLRCAKRDVFLDTDSEKQAIRRKLIELAQKAEDKGTGIGIGHCYRNTLEVLREEIPELQKQGFQFIHLSQAVR